MKILVTGAKGFLGRNLISGLRNSGYSEVFEFDRDTGGGVLSGWAGECDFVFHLAGANRPRDDSEFMEVNFGLTEKLLGLLGKRGRKPPFLFSSTAQAVLDNPYGRSKKAAEEIVFGYGRHAPVFVYRLTNLFGKWSRPDYNSVVATYCHNIARGLPVRVDEPGRELELCWVEDAVDEFLRALSGRPARDREFCRVPESYGMTLGELEKLIRGFAAMRLNAAVPDSGDDFLIKLYGTYLSFLPEDGLSYPLEPKGGENGFFAEFIKTPERGQVSVNVLAPGSVRGNHWHRRKTEKFLVASGEAVIRLRRIDSERITEYRVSGGKPAAVEIPPGFTHTLENVSDRDIAVVIWASEVFNPESPDTYKLEL